VTGIAIVLAIELLNIYNTAYLEQNARAINGGDISLIPAQNNLSGEQRAWLDALQSNGVIDYTDTVWITGNITDKQKSSVVILRFIDTEKDPFYSAIATAGNFKTSLTRPDSLILSQNAADRIQAQKGDEVRILNNYSGRMEYFQVSDIVPGDGESGQDMNIFGYALISNEQLAGFTGNSDITSKVYIKVPQGVIDSNLLDQFKQHFPSATINTAEDVFKENREQMANTSRALSVIGLLAFLVAGLGIAVTMLLSIIKRQRELSLLKVFGMKRHHLLVLIGIEALLMALAANVVGIPAGIVCGTIINKVIYAGWIDYSNIALMLIPALRTLALSLVISLIFALIPALYVNRLRITTVLREQSVKTAEKSGIVLPVLITALIIAAASTVFLKSIVLGIALVGGVLAVGTLLYWLSRLLLSLMSKIPVKNNETIKLALRNSGNQKGRFALVIVTLICGLMAAGLSLNLSNSILPSLKNTIKNELGYNVLVTTGQSTADRLDSILTEDKNVKGYSQAVVGNVSVKSLNGVNQEAYFQEQMQNPVYAARLAQMQIEGLQEGKQPIQFKMTEGEWLSRDDLDPVCVINYTLAEGLNIKTGDLIGLEIEGQERTFRVKGIKENSMVNTSQITTAMATLQPLISGQSVRYYVDVKDGKIESFTNQLNTALDNIFVLNIEDITRSLSDTIRKSIIVFIFAAAFCILTAILLMSNMTLMTYLERIREFTLLKILGAKDRYLRGMVITESLIIGTSAGLLACLLTELASRVLFKLMHIDYLVAGGTIWQIMGIAIAVMISATLLIIPQIKIKQLHILLRAE
jgi:predicted lysophospholipase L1 biosynthesis ABC-type transport system permease subunit